MASRRPDFLQAVLTGLAKPRKAIPCQFLYDDIGSELFERICSLDEYYPTRTEIGLLERHRHAMAELIGPEARIIELGSGSSHKVRLLLDALIRPAGYVAVDIAREPLRATAAALAADYPEVEVVAVCADYTRVLAVPPPHRRMPDRRVIFFPGSTIGNLAPPEARSLLQECARLVRRGGGMLVGVDLRKDVATLHAAYNDAQGVTAAFNLNILDRVNRELGGDIDRSAFHHRAWYNAVAGRMEMHVVSARRQVVTVAGQGFPFAPGETIHTENAYKYTLAGFQRLAAQAGFAAVRAWTDRDALFSLHYLEAL